MASASEITAAAKAMYDEAIELGLSPEDACDNAREKVAELLDGSGRVGRFDDETLTWTEQLSFDFEEGGSKFRAEWDGHESSGRRFVRVARLDADGDPSRWTESENEEETEEDARKAARLIVISLLEQESDAAALEALKRDIDRVLSRPGCEVTVRAVRGNGSTVTVSARWRDAAGRETASWLEHFESDPGGALELANDLFANGHPDARG